MLHLRLLCLCFVIGIVKHIESTQINYYMLQDFLSRLRNEPDQLDAFDPSQLGNNIFDSNENYRIRKDLVGENNELIERYNLQARDDLLLPHDIAAPRKESLEHSLLYGHQYVQGGAGEGKQHLKPDGSVENVQVIKSDSVLPAYCNPPNPCPLGYTAEDGCLEEFENTAQFSKAYQASQECMCDSEHMFNCMGNSNENELDALARSIQNEGLSDNALDKIMKNIDDKQSHKVVAKKFFTKRSLRSKRSAAKTAATRKQKVCIGSECVKKNPFLVGDKLPVVAKKSPHLAKL